MPHKLTTSLSLDTRDDADIIEWLRQQDNKSAAIRDAVRSAIKRDVSLSDVYRAIEELNHKIDRGMVIQESVASAPPSYEPEDAARALDALAEMSTVTTG